MSSNARPAALPVVTAYEGEPPEQIGRATTIEGARRVARAFMRRGDFKGAAGAWDFNWGSKTISVWA